MVHEKSCGAVIYSHINGEIVYLIEKMRSGHYSICKGHVENGENEHETAVREILEETNLSVEFIDGFRKTIEYSPRPGCIKEVVFFLAKSDTTDTIPQECEVSKIVWLNFEDALKTLTHESDRGVLTEANTYLTK